LTDRANKGLVEWKETDISQIAALTTRRTNSDTRIAIKTLYYSVTEPSVGVEGNFERAQREIVVDMIANVSDANLMILLAAARCREPHAKLVYRLYSQVTQARGDTPFSYVYFYSNLSYLQSIGLVALVSAKVGRTYTNRVLLSFDPDILQPILDARLAA
jgi:Cdc6-like AAA superfamily ATPase